MSDLISISHKPITIEKNSSLFNAITKLSKNNISRLVVIENGLPVGIITEKDIGLFLLADETERKLDEISVAEITKKIISIEGHVNPVTGAQRMLTNGIGSLVVTDNDNVVGIITKTDLIRYFTKNHPQEKIVGEYMSPYYAWQYSDTPLYKTVKKMINEKISRVILRNHEEIPVGIVTFRNLFHLSLKLGEEEDILDNSDPVISVVFPRKGFVSESGFGGTTKIEEIMSKDIVSVNYDDDLAKAGQMLLDKNINGAGVLSARGNIIGIISKTDIVKALAFLKIND